MIDPSWVEIKGQKIPLYFSIRAAATMEKELDIRYPVLLEKIFASEKDGDGIESSLVLEDQVKILACVMQEGQRAAGVQCDPLDTIVEKVAALHVDDFNTLTLAATAEMLFKSAKKEDEPKNS